MKKNKNIKEKTDIKVNDIFIIERFESDFIKKFLKKISLFFDSQIFPDSKNKFVVGLSGGIDSVVLLDVFYILSKKYGFEVIAAHFNHKLRDKESDIDEKFSKNLAEKYNFKFYSGNGNVRNYSEKNKISIELAARTLRYNFFERTSRNIDADYVATAHHKDDLSETFIINLFRGSGLKGLRGIPQIRKLVKNVRLIRPLLDFTKEDIINYAKERKLKWREDSSNKISDYTRNKVRNELIPIMKKDFSVSVIDTIARAAKHINGANEIISDYVENNLTKVVDEVEQEKVSLNLNILKTYSEFIQGELLIAILKKYFRINSINLNNIDRILYLQLSETGSFAELPEKIIAIKDRDFLILSRKSINFDYKEKIAYPGEYRIGKYKLKLDIVTKRQIKLTPDSNVEFFDMSLLPTFLEIRTWKDGDHFTPLGMNGTMKVSDFLTNNKVSVLEKSNVLVLTNQVDIIWVCGYRINEKYKINNNTKKALKAQLVIS